MTTTTNVATVQSIIGAEVQASANGTKPVPGVWDVKLATAVAPVAGDTYTANMWRHTAALDEAIRALETAGWKVQRTGSSPLTGVHTAVVGRA